MKMNWKCRCPACTSSREAFLRLWQFCVQPLLAVCVGVALAFVFFGK